MPELPEVETIRKDLEDKMLYTKVVQLDFVLPKSIKSNKSVFKKNVLGGKFRKIDRKGKLMMFYLDKSNMVMLVHLRMTGQLIYQKGERMIAGGHSEKERVTDLPNRHTRVIFEFADGGKLFFNDLRTFGYLELIDESEILEKTKNYGKDAINDKYDFEWFKNKLKGRKTLIKAALLDQKIIAGIGNIYADEILFRASVDPRRRVNDLKKLELKKIFEAIRPILKMAIKHRGTTFNDYRDSDGNKGNFVDKLKVFGRQGEKCTKCDKEIIDKIKVAGRGTHYCPKCQK